MESPGKAPPQALNPNRALVLALYGLGSEGFKSWEFRAQASFYTVLLQSHGTLPKGPIVVPSWGSYLEFYKVIPKRNYYGRYG